MNKIRDVLQRTRVLAVTAAFALAMLISLVPMQMTSAMNVLSSRSLVVTSTVANDLFSDPSGVQYPNTIAAGDSRNGLNVGHTYKFSPATVGAIKSISIQYCSTPFGYIGSCVTPTGFTSVNATSASVKVNAGSPVTFTRDASSTAQLLKLTDATGVTTASASDVVTVTFTPSGTRASATNYFTNPSSGYTTSATGNPSDWGTYFAHAKTFSDAAWTTAVDEGTMTNSVSTSISIYTRVQEILKFSVEGDDAADGATAAGAGCQPLTASGLINMGDTTNHALDSGTAYTAVSFFRLSTNASNGAAVYFSGLSLASSSHTLTPIVNTGATSTTGTEQFGLGIDATASTLNQLSATSPYGSAGAGTPSYAFDATSATAPVQIASSSQLVTCDTAKVMYLANISPNTPAGIYMTKVNYIAAPVY